MTSDIGVTPGNRILIVMAKAPITGTVKTRLCPPLEPVCASALYHCFLKDMIETVSDLSEIDAVVAYSPPNSQDFFLGLAPDASSFVAQCEGDIGERMSRCLDIFCNGSRSVIIIGADSPTLPTNLIMEAFDILAAHQSDLVIGPSMDGGYYLIGMNQPHPELFMNIGWSTSDVFAQTVKRVSGLGLQCTLLEEWYDIDTYEDLIRLMKEVDDWHPDYGRFPTHTAEILNQLERNN